MHSYTVDTFGDEILDRLTLERLLSSLTDEEREILHLWYFEELTFQEIGKIVGLKYRGRELADSTMGYHRDRILRKLRQEASAA